MAIVAYPKYHFNAINAGLIVHYNSTITNTKNIIDSFDYSPPDVKSHPEWGEKLLVIIQVLNYKQKNRI